MGAPVVDLRGNWRMTQSNGFTVDVSMNQAEGRLDGFCTHSNGQVRSNNASGTAVGDGFTFIITWDNGSMGEYVGRLEQGFATLAHEGIMRGTTKDLNSPSNTATWEVHDRVF